MRESISVPREIVEEAKRDPMSLLRRAPTDLELQEMINTVGKRVKILREGNDWTQEELARRANLTVPTIGNIEAGHREPSFSTLVSLCGALKVSADYLLGIKPAYDHEELLKDDDTKFVLTKLLGYSEADKKLVFDHINFIDFRNKKDKMREASY